MTADASKLFMEGYEKYRIRQFDEAIALLTRAVELEPEDDGYWMYLGAAYRHNRDHAGAEIAFGKMVELQPDGPYGWFYRGRARFAQGKYEAAIEDFDQADRLEEDGVYDQGLDELFRFRAAAHETLGNYEQAISDYQAFGALSGNRSFAEEQIKQIEGKIKR